MVPAFSKPTSAKAGWRWRRRMLDWLAVAGAEEKPRLAAGISNFVGVM